MATLSHVESRHLYSWWWGSHISPKNSKWLQENLTDMDMKIKAMIKLIEEDADSFRRRAEMYYRKRPELMKLVEEFYRAYRALAERYDHATGVLRQAHRTIAEAFPNQIPFVLSDESPSGSDSIEVEPHTPEMVPPVRALFDADDSLKDSSIISSHSHAIKRNRAFSEEKDATTSKEGLRQLNEMFSTEEESARVNFSNGRVRKGMNFQEEEGESSKDKVLQEKLSQLSKENQDLKNQITSESVRADKAKTEVESLKGTLSELESEKEATLLRCQLSQERVCNLEAEISRTQEDFKKLNDEMLIEITKLKTVEERSLLLEKENQSLQLELDTFKETAKKQREELEMKQEELEKLNISIQDEHRQSIQAEMARLSMEKLHSQSQEEVRLLASEIQSGVEKLKNMELSKVGLEEEVRRLKEENGSLNEQFFSSALKITKLQDEIGFLKESKRKLEDEVGLYVEEIKVLQQEVCSLKADKKDFEQRHHGLTDQIEAVNLNVESLQALIKELRDGNVELKEMCKKHEDEKVLHLENLKQMEKISEKNAVLENSLSDANVELEGLREKIKTLEESCESLHGKISIHISEKAVLVSQIEAIAQNMEKLSEKNTLLENSLSDVNVEFKVLRGKLTVLEESCQSLYDQKFNLLAEKSILVSQVESISQSLENLENRYAELEGKNLNLEREKDLMLNQVSELQDSLKLEKEEHETLMQSSKSQLATLENRICLLQEEGQFREEEFEVEQHEVVKAQIEIFILKRCLCDMKEKNLILSDMYQKYLETSSCAEKLIAELQQESFIQKKELTSLSEYNKKLVEGIHHMMKALNISKNYGSPDDLLLELILHEIRDLQTSISDAQEDIQHLILEKSVLLILLEQFGLDVADLKSEKNLLKRDSKLRFEELSVLQSEKCQLLEINEHLRQNVQACNQREEVLTSEMEILCRQLSDLREAHSTLQSEISKLLEENQSLSKKNYDLREKQDTLEEVNSVILAEAMTLDYLYLIFRSYNAERALELQLLGNDLDFLRGVRNDLDQEIRIMNEKVGALEVENMSLKESVVDLEECRRRLVILEDDANKARNVCEQLNLQIETGQNLLVRKDMELLDANQKIKAIQDKNTELSRKLEGLMLDIDGATLVKEELEKKIFTLTEDNVHRDNEIACLRQAYDKLNGELDKLHEEVDELRKRERHLISEMKEGTDEVKSCEVEITRLLKELQITTINAAVFEEKMLELLITCESLEISAMVQREMLYKDITQRNVYEDKLKEKLDALLGENKGLKEELGAYLPLVLSLCHDVASLEKHALSLVKHHALSNQEKQDNLLVSLQHKNSNQEQNEDHNATASAGILELQKLHAKVKALEKVVIDTQSCLEQERFVSNASLEFAMREIEGLKSKGSTGQEEAQISKDIVLHLIKNEEPGKLQNGDAEISREKFEQTMKDIQLDHVLSSQYENGASSNVLSTTEISQTNDQMLESWETVDCNKMEKASPVNSERDLEYHQIEAVEEEKSECPSSELVAEKELSIDKLELPKKVTESHQEWSGSVSERLSSDAQRLSVLQKSVKELKRTMETSELSNSPTTFEFDNVKAQLKEAEGAILQSIDINSKLTKKAEVFSASSDSLVGEQNDEMGNISARKISERARRRSEKIGRLELELQKIQYILLKLKEEHDNKKTRAAVRTRRVLLRDYLYGRRESPRRKKVHCCIWMSSKTKDE